MHDLKTEHHSDGVRVWVGQGLQTLVKVYSLQYVCKYCIIVIMHINHTSSAPYLRRSSRGVEESRESIAAARLVRLNTRKICCMRHPGRGTSSTSSSFNRLYLPALSNGCNCVQTMAAARPLRFFGALSVILVFFLVYQVVKPVEPIAPPPPKDGGKIDKWDKDPLLDRMRSIAYWHNMY